MARSKVKSRSDYDVAHLHPLTNVPSKYQLPTPHSFRDIAQTRFYRSRSLRQGQIKVRPWRCTPTHPNQCPYQVSTSFTLQFLRYSPDKLFPTSRPPEHHVWKQYNDKYTTLLFIIFMSISRHKIRTFCTWSLLHCDIINDIIRKQNIDFLHRWWGETVSLYMPNWK